MNDLLYNVMFVVFVNDAFDYLFAGIVLPCVLKGAYHNPTKSHVAAYHEYVAYISVTLRFDNTPM